MLVFGHKSDKDKELKNNKNKYKNGRGGMAHRQKKGYLKEMSDLENERKNNKAVFRISKIDPFMDAFPEKVLNSSAFEDTTLIHPSIIH